MRRAKDYLMWIQQLPEYLANQAQWQWHKSRTAPDPSFDLVFGFVRSLGVV
jgi:hypothetical protein